MGDPPPGPRVLWGGGGWGLGRAERQDLAVGRGGRCQQALCLAAECRSPVSTAGGQSWSRYFLSVHLAPEPRLPSDALPPGLRAALLQPASPLGSPGPAMSMCLPVLQARPSAHSSAGTGGSGRSLPLQRVCRLPDGPLLTGLVGTSCPSSTWGWDREPKPPPAAAQDLVGPHLIELRSSYTQTEVPGEGQDGLASP